MGHHIELGVSAWFWSTLCFVWCLIICRGHRVDDGGLANMDYVQNESHGFEVIGDCPMLLK